MTSQEVHNLVLVKFGGSLLTDKTESRSLRRDVVVRLAEEVAESFADLESAGWRLIVGHGSGSFGHSAAVEVGYKAAPRAGSPRPRRSAADGAIVRRAALELHQHLLDALVDAGLPAFSFPPAGFLAASAGELRLSSTDALDPLLAALDQGFLPVVFGDVIVDSVLAYTIASTEEVFLRLVCAMPAQVATGVVLWFGDTDGVLDKDGATIGRLTPDEDQPHLDATRGRDVTGGMRLRLDTVFELARRGVPSRLLNGLRPGAVKSALLAAGSIESWSDSGTRVVASSQVRCAKDRAGAP